MWKNRPRDATARAASKVEVEILTPNEFFDQITGSPRVVRELIQRLSRRLREADDRIVNDERRSGEPRETSKDADSQKALELVKNAYLSAKNPWLRTQLHELVGLGDLPFVVGGVSGNPTAGRVTILTTFAHMREFHKLRTNARFICCVVHCGKLHVGLAP